ncbi:hypothetical protein NFI96_013430 [Prochilodus magdalenae]|nr:hypothetical protein NFI96_013430 [Prochilodus magdalenae]
MNASTSFTNMKTKMLTGLLLLLTAMSDQTSCMADGDLECYNDQVDTVTCEWNSSATFNSRPPTSPKINCSLHSTCGWSPLESNLVPFESSKPELLKAQLKVSIMCLIYLPVEVRCGGVIKASIEMDGIKTYKPYPPEQPEVDRANVSWKLDFRQPSDHSYIFEMQFKQKEQRWEEVEAISVQSMNVLLPEDRLLFGREYTVRVRVKAIYYWSDWSSPTEWTATVGKRSAEPTDVMPWWFPSVTGTAVVITIAVILGVFFRSHPSTCFPKSPETQNPFEKLYTDHGGNFKLWLGTTVSPEFFKANLEYTSTPEICKILDDAEPCKKVEDHKKSFSNSTYFLSQSSKCAMMDPLEPCSEQCPYGPTGGGSVEEKASLTSEVDHNSDTDNEVNMSDPLDMSSSYKHLQKLRLDVQSPDSGFAAGSDQDSQEESGSEGLPSPPVVDVPPLPSAGALLCPIPQVHHMSGLPHLMLPPLHGFVWSPQNTSVFETRSSSIATNTLMANPDIMNFSVMVEPSDDDYMPIKKVQE